MNVNGWARNNATVKCKTVKMAVEDQSEAAFKLFISVINLNSSAEWMCIKKIQVGIEEVYQVPTQLLSTGCRYHVVVALMKYVLLSGKTEYEDHYEKIASESASFFLGKKFIG